MIDVDLIEIVLYSSTGSKLATLQVDNNMEASMNRAHAYVQHEVALALARYLSRECGGIDPNPSGHMPDTEVKQPNASQQEAASLSNGQVMPLIPDLEYSVNDAHKITNLAEVTVRKMMKDGRLPYQRKGSRVFITGKELARVIARQLSHESSVAEDPKKSEPSSHNPNPEGE